jgi:hypothetical protein
MEIFTKPQILALTNELVMQYGMKGAADKLKLAEVDLRNILTGKLSIKKILLRLGLTTVYVRKKEIN